MTAKEIEQVAIKVFNPNTDEYEYGQLFYSKENGYELKNKNGDLLTNVMIQRANDDYFKMKNILKIIKEYKVNVSVIIYCIENDIDYAEYVRRELWDDAQENEPAYPMEESEYDLLKECLK